MKAPSIKNLIYFYNPLIINVKAHASIEVSKLEAVDDEQITVCIVLKKSINAFAREH